MAVSAPFAALEARANGVAHARLSNVVGFLDGVQVAGIFENEYLAIEGVGTGAPALVLPSALACSAVEERSVFLKGAVLAYAKPYTVVRIEPDGSGMTVLHLREA